MELLPFPLLKISGTACCYCQLLLLPDVVTANRGKLKSMVLGRPPVALCDMQEGSC